MTTEVDKRSEVNREIKEQDPPIVVGDYWIATDDDGTVMRKLRIVGTYPFENEYKYIITLNCPAKIKTGRDNELDLCPEFNLRYVFRPEPVDDRI